jgi:hypothetical protein
MRARMTLLVWVAQPFAIVLARATEYARAMRKVVLALSSGVLLAAAGAAVFACSSSSSGGGGTTNTEGGVEGGGNTTQEGGGFDGGMAAPGTLSTGTIAGITTDDWALVIDAKHDTLTAVSALDPTMTQTLCPGAGSDYAVSGKAIICTQATAGTPGPTFLFTKASGFALIGQTSVTTGAAVSPDGKNVLVFRNIMGTGAAATADVFVVGTDGMMSNALATGVNMAATTMSWAGTFAVTVTQESAEAGTSDAGTALVSVSTFDSTNAWKRADVATDAVSVATSGAGTSIAVVASDGTLYTYPGAGGSPTTIDSNTTRVDMLPDGKTLIYGIPGGIKRSVVTGGTPLYLIAMGVTDLGVVTATSNSAFPAGISADGNTLFFATGTTGAMAQLAITTANVGNTATLLDSTQVATASLWPKEVAGDLFTADSQYVLYNSYAASATTSVLAKPAMTGAPVAIGTAGQTSPTKWALKGSTVAYLSGGKISTIDVKAGTTKDVITGALYTGAFFVTAARDKVVYTLGMDATDKAAVTFVAAIP